MSDSLGRENFSGSDSTSAVRHSLGKANPIVEPSREKDRYTIRPIRNFTRPRTKASLLRGSALATARTSSTVTTDLGSGFGRAGVQPADAVRDPPQREAGGQGPEQVELEPDRADEQGQKPVPGACEVAQEPDVEETRRGEQAGEYG